MNRLLKFVEGKQKSGFLILVAIGIFAVTSSFASEPGAVQEIQLVPEVLSVGPSLPGGGNFGTLDEIDPDGVIIGDSYHKFASSVIFLSTSGKPVSRLKVKLGSIVHFKVNANNELILMWPEPGHQP